MILDFIRVTSAQLDVPLDLRFLFKKCVDDWGNFFS